MTCFAAQRMLFTLLLVHLASSSPLIEALQMLCPVRPHGVVFYKLTPTLIILLHISSMLEFVALCVPFFNRSGRIPRPFCCISTFCFESPSSPPLKVADHSRFFPVITQFLYLVAVCEREGACRLCRWSFLQWQIPFATEL